MNVMFAKTNIRQSLILLSGCYRTQMSRHYSGFCDKYSTTPSVIGALIYRVSEFITGRPAALHFRAQRDTKNAAKCGNLAAHWIN